VQVRHVCIIMAIRAVGGSFHWPAMQASTSLMVPHEQLTRVSGLNQTLNGVLNIAGPPLGALLMEVMPLYSIMLVDVGTASLAILPLCFMRVPQPERKEESAKRTTILADMREGARYILNWQGLVILIAIAMIIKIALTPAFSLLPLLVSKHFEGGAAQLSLLEAVVGAGIIVGGVLLSVWGGFKRRIYTTMSGLVVLGTSFLALGFVPGSAFVAALVIIFLVGLTIPMIDGPIMAILQSAVAPEVQGRVFTIMSSLIWITSPFSLAIAGPISDWLGLQMWYLLAGTLCGTAGLVSFFIPAAVNIEQNNAAGKQEKQLGLANVQVL
jgi:DHA3 family macrolide efflux protein-like MFS transporter